MTSLLKTVSYIVLLAMVLCVPCVSAQDNKLIGVWKITDARTIPASDQNQKPKEIRNYRPEIMIFTKSIFSWVDNHGEALPDLQEENPNVAYFATAFDQLTAVSGSYEVKGSSIEVSVTMSKMPKVIRKGAFLRYQYEFEKDVLVLTWHTPTKDKITFKLARLK